MTPSNDHPEIPSLKPAGDKEEKKGTGLAPSSAPKPSSGFKFPGFGTAGKGASAPSLRVRGLPGGSTVMDRLKNLRKKDLIFIAAGLCTLGMAPLAEHLLMAPEDSSGQLKEGFSTQGPLFADGSTVYESGSGVGSPGALIGQGTDVITPLNVRDPSNLVMSPGSTKKQDAVVTPPPPPPSSGKPEPDWRDVLKDSAKGAASAAVKSAGKLPKPNVKMAGAIRGLSALGGGGGGTGASLKLDPLKAEHAPNRATGSNALSRVQATPGFRGATSRSPASSGAGEDLKAAGMRQADVFNKGGGAAGALDAASREAIPSGGAGNFGGRPNQGDETKSPGGSNHKDSKQLGESLAFLRQRMEMEKSMDLKWKKKEWSEFGRQKMLEESAIKMGFDMFGKFAEKAVLEPFANMIGNAVAGGGDKIGWECEMVNGGGKQRFPASGPPNSTRQGSTFYDKNGQPVAKNCTKVVLGGSDTGTPAPENDRWSGNQRGVPGGAEMRRRQQQMESSRGDLSANKAQLADIQNRLRGVCTQTPTAPQCAMLPQLEKLTPIYGKLETAASQLSEAWKQLDIAAKNMDKEQAALGDSARLMQAGADKLTEAHAALKLEGDKTKPDTKTADAAVTAAAESLKQAAVRHKDAQMYVEPTNKAMTASDQAARTGDGSAVKNIDGAQADLGGVTLPPKEADAAKLGQWADSYGAAYGNAEAAVAKARASIQAMNGQYSEWVGVYDPQAVEARKALHGSFDQAAAPNVEVPPAVGAAPRSELGVMGQIHRNMIEHTVALSDVQKKALVTAAGTHYEASYTKPMTNFDGSAFGVDAAHGGQPFPGYPLDAPKGQYLEQKDAVQKTYVSAAQTAYNEALKTGAGAGAKTDPVGQWVELNQGNSQGSMQGVQAARKFVSNVGAGLKPPAPAPTQAAAQ